jgi:hypothetical protein
MRACATIVAVLGDGRQTAFEIAGGLWPERTVMQQPLLVVWEVIGNLELLLAAGAVIERVGDAGSVFELTSRTAPPLGRRPRRRPDCAGHR